jgi:hypothetical protein
LQALSLLNNSFVLRMSDRFAERVEREAGDEGDRLEVAFLVAVGREPTTEETEMTQRLVQDQGLAALCRALLNSNEFLYVD